MAFKPNQEDDAAGFHLTPFVNTAPGQLFFLWPTWVSMILKLGRPPIRVFWLPSTAGLGEGTAKIDLAPFAGGTVLFNTSLGPAGVPLLLGENKSRSNAPSNKRSVTG